MEVIKCDRCRREINKYKTYKTYYSYEPLRNVVHLCNGCERAFRKWLNTKGDDSIGSSTD